MVLSGKGGVVGCWDDAKEGPHHGKVAAREAHIELGCG